MATQADFERVLEKLEARRVGANWMARCPAHEDRTASMSVSFENNKILFHCHAGCTQDSVLEKFRPVEVAHYDYLDENKKLLYQVVRYDRMGAKEFKQRRPGTNGTDWIWSVKGARHVLYHTEELADAKIVMITEGEKDVETLRSHGYIASCNVGGAGNWIPEYSEQLRGKHVIIIPDNDEAGEKHLIKVAQSLTKLAATIGIARVPSQFKDVTEWGPTREGLGILIKYAIQWCEEPKDWRTVFHTHEDFENAPPLSFSIDNFLQNDAITAFAGLSGHGKTFVALSICKALLYGPGKLWGWFKVNERAERVVYLIPESTLTPFKHRLKMMGLYEEIQSGRLLVRTLSKGPTLELEDPRILWAAKSAHVVLDTAIRFIGEADDNKASEVANGLSEDFTALLRAGAKTVFPLFHSAKEFRKAEVMNLENMIRGSGELGAILATAWGIRQVDGATNTIFIQNLKPRDFEPCGPFEICGRPYIQNTGDFVMLKQPGECGALSDEQPELASKKSNVEKREAKAANVAHYARWIRENPDLSAKDIVERFKELGVHLSEATVRNYAMKMREKK